MANWSDKSEKKNYMQKYKDAYSKQYSCIVKSSKSDKHAFCMICSVDISVSYSPLFWSFVSLFLNFAG